MNNKSMLPIFNKLSDLFKSKVYVDSGPLEQQDTKVKCRQYILKEDIPVHSNDQKNTALYQKEESSNLTTKQVSADLGKEKEMTDGSVSNNFYFSPLASDLPDLKTVFNV